MKRIAIIPTLCTLGNACCGFASIICAAQIQAVPSAEPTKYLHLFAVSGVLIFAAMVFDALDGYLARLSKTASQFGAELDSLCDAISFGAAPAFLLIRLGGGIEQRVMRDALYVIATLYMICAILRLARFNTQTNIDPESHRIFRGLPSPAAAGCIASLAVARYDYFDKWEMSDAVVGAIMHWFAPLGALTVALLMVSRVPYKHLMNQLLSRRKHKFSELVQLVAAVAAVLLLFWLYALASPIILLVNRSMHRRALPVIKSP
jgi:CDP-diacylglycerol--serine O-phosphatidyltransferase